MKEPSTQGFYRPDGSFDLVAYKAARKLHRKFSNVKTTERETKTH